MSTLLGWIVVSVGLVTAFPAAGQAVWQTYVHPVFGAELEYPVDLFPERQDTSTGVILSGAGAQIEVTATYASTITSPSALLSVIESQPGYESITYSPSGETWLVVSGYRGEDVYYEKFFLADGTVQAFAIQYPVSLRTTFDPVLAEIEDRFRSGEPAQPAG